MNQAGSSEDFCDKFNSTRAKVSARTVVSALAFVILAAVSILSALLVLVYFMMPSMDLIIAKARVGLFR